MTSSLDSMPVTLGARGRGPKVTSFRALVRSFYSVQKFDTNGSCIFLCIDTFAILHKCLDRALLLYIFIREV